MHRWKRATLSLGVCLALVGLAVLTGSVSGARTAHAAAADATGFVYVNDNTSGTKLVAGYLWHIDGSLTPLPGSPFYIGGAGTGTVTLAAHIAQTTLRHGTICGGNATYGIHAVLSLEVKNT
jgi:hypothetical protein